MGFKRWARLEEVTSDDLNDYLALQIVARFATASQRAAQIPAPEEGQVSLLLDTGRTDVYLNGAWTPLPGTMLARKVITTDVGIPVAWGDIVRLPAATYHAGHAYALACNLACGNVTGAARGTAFRWAKVTGGEVIAQCANVTLANNERITFPADYVWVPAADYAGELVLQGFADAAMGATGGNGVLGSSTPIVATATAAGAAHGSAAGAVAADEPTTLPAPDDDPAPAPRARRRKGSSS